MPPALRPVADSDLRRDVAVGEACRRGLGTLRGAVVAMDPYTGRVLAVREPPLGVERAYQPCSVFKIVVAIAGPDRGRDHARDRRTPATGGCWMWPGHGPIDLRRALAVSCNPYFEWVGEQLGYEKVQRYAQLLGLGAPSGINLAGETAGALPLVRAARPRWATSRATRRASPRRRVQLAVLLSATINGGIVFQPQVAAATGFVPKERWRLPEGTVAWAAWRKASWARSTRGAPTTAFDPDVMVAGKTGTCAGVGWFASYAPADDPEIVIVMFVNPGTGHWPPAVAGRIYQYLYKPAPPVVLGGG